MNIETERLFLRKWTVRDADSLFRYAKNPNVGPMAGWPIHKNVEESKFVIENVLNGAECYAICLKDSNVAIGSIELKLNGNSNLTNNDDECELGFWLAEEYWGKGFVPEASKALILRVFNDLNNI